MSRVKPIAWIMKFYISVMRGTPLMLQMFFIYFAPYYIFGIPLSMESKFSATIVAFIINYAAYFAEIYRSGIQSIPRGQYEAAEVLGYSRLQTFMKIVLPQVIKRILPAMGNEIITLVKDTSLAFAIGVAEMFSTAKALGRLAGEHAALRVRSGFLLGIQFRRGSGSRARREEDGLLPRLAVGKVRFGNA